MFSCSIREPEPGDSAIRVGSVLPTGTVDYTASIYRGGHGPEVGPRALASRASQGNSNPRGASTLVSHQGNKDLGDSKSGFTSSGWVGMFQP